MRIIVTGSNGQVGKSITNLALSNGYKVYPFGHDLLDISSPNQVKEQLKKIKPNIVINCAAYTNVDNAETNQIEAYQVNELGPMILAQECNLYNCKIVHLSTDYIFDGSKATSYTENDKPNPQNFYGLTKLNGEKNILKFSKDSLVLRVSWVFSLSGPCFPQTIYKKAILNDNLTVISDQVGGPTSADSIAQVILVVINLISKNQDIPWGVYHFCQQPYVSWFQFAQNIIEYGKGQNKINMNYQIKECLSNDFNQIAIRPNNSMLNCNKIRQKLGIEISSWEKDLHDYLANLDY